MRGEGMTRSAGSSRPITNSSLVKDQWPDCPSCSLPVRKASLLIYFSTFFTFKIPLKLYREQVSKKTPAYRGFLAHLAHVAPRHKKDLAGFSKPARSEFAATPGVSG